MKNRNVIVLFLILIIIIISLFLFKYITSSKQFFGFIPRLTSGVIFSNLTKENQDNFSFQKEHSGKIELLIFDDFENKKVIYEYNLLTDSGEKIKLVPSDSLREIQDLIGKKVVVYGDLKNSKIINPNIVATEMTDSSNSAGDIKTKNYKLAIVLAHFSNTTPHQMPISEIRKMMYDDDKTDHNSVAGFINEATYGKYKLVGKNSINGSQDIYGWYALPHDNTGCATNYQTWIDEAKTKAIQSGYNSSGYDVTYYILNGAQGCNFAGITFSSGLIMVTGIWPNNMAHELGHAMGLISHSNAIRCFSGGANDIPRIYNINGFHCQEIEYGDPFDIMGGINWNHFNIFRKKELGIVPKNKILEILNQNDGEYELYGQEDLSDGYKLINIYTQTDSRLTLELRKSFGIWDNFLTTDPVVNGLSLRYDNKIIDTHPNTATFNDAPLLVGESYVDPFSGRTIRLISIENNKAKVFISSKNINNGTCLQNQLSIFPNKIKLNSPSKSFTLKITNNNSAACLVESIKIPTVVKISEGSPSIESVLTSVPFYSGESKQFNVLVSTSKSLPYGYYDGLIAIDRVNPELASGFRFSFDYQNTGCVRQYPSFSIDPENLKISSGSLVKSFSYSIKNNDNVLCSSGFYSVSTGPAYSSNGGNYLTEGSNVISSVPIQQPNNGSIVPMVEILPGETFTGNVEIKYIDLINRLPLSVELFLTKSLNNSGTGYFNHLVKILNFEKDNSLPGILKDIFSK